MCEDIGWRLEGIPPALEVVMPLVTVNIFVD